MTRKFTFLLMALLALTGFKSWGNPVVSSPSGSNDGEYYNITVNDQTPTRWTFMCSQNAEQGTSVQVSYFPGTGYETYEPHVTCVITGTDQSVELSDFTYNSSFGYYFANFTMPANHVTVTASFEPSGNLYNVHPQTPFTGGTVSFGQTDNLPEGAMVKMWVTPDTQNHYTFDEAHYQDKISVKYGENLSQSVTVSAYSNYYFFYMPAADVTVDVIFDEEPNYTITVNNPEGCTITLLTEPKYYEGREIYFEYELASGYRFNSWNVKYDDGVHVSPQSVTVYDNKPWNGDYYFIMPEGPVTITANVTQVTTHTITVVQPTVGGTISVSTNEAALGDAVYIYTYPATGYTLNKWYVKNESGVVVIEDVTAGFYMPDYNVTVTADFVLEPQDLPVNDGETTLQDIPFNTYYSDGSYTKSQFIIPSNDLINMFDGTITNLTFFNSYSSYFAFTGTWNVYMKEVDHTTIQNSEYFPTSEEDLVYAGPLSLNSGMLEIALTHPYTYSDGNLMLCFEQTSLGNATNNPTNWYGVTAQSDVCRTGYDYSYGGGYHYNYNFLPKTTFRYMPSANPQTRYAITVNQPEVGGSISASKAFAVEGTTISLTATPAEGYVLDSWVVTDGNGSIEVTDNQFAVRTSDVTVTATFKTLPRYAITITPNEHGAVRVNNDETPDENGYLEGAIITLIAEGNEGWTLADDGYSITPSDPTVTVEIQQGAYGSYYFQMPACNVTISSTFRELEQYTVTYHFNGVASQETVYEGDYFYPSQPMTLPAGTEWFGWVTEDLGNAYTTTQPGNKFDGGQIDDDMDLYAVFKFTEIIPLEGESSWSQIYTESELEDGDRLVLANSKGDYDENWNWVIQYYIMSQRDEELANHFTSTLVEDPIYNNTTYRNEFSSLPTNATILTAEKLEGGKWKFHFVDAYKGENTLANVYGSNLVPYDLWSGVGACDTWEFEYGCYIKSTLGEYQYISFEDNLTYNINSYNQPNMYKEVKPVQTNYYYMTSVLGFGGADEHIASNTEATNVVIAKNAKLTIDNGAALNVEGICLSASHDAAQLVIADGGQLVHHNEGTVATFEKTITAYTGEYDNYYFIANPTDEEYVEGLGLDGIDLYTFDPATDGEGNEWINEAYVNNNTNIERGTGYLYANQTGTTLSFAGELVPANSTEYSGMSLVLAETGEGRDFPGFNLIGNPYACNVYLEKPAYLLYGGEYLSIAANTAIAPCEGFFVEAESNGENLSISTTNLGLRSNSICLTVNQNRGNVIDRAIVSFDGSSNLHKFMLNPAHTNIRLAKNGEEFAALSSDAEGEIPVSFKAEKDGTYTITVNTENVEANYLHLIDNMTGADTDLLNTPSYTFNATTSDYASRFKLVFNMKNDNAEANLNSFAYISNGELIISNEGRATLQVIDVMGRIVRNQQIEGDARISTEGMTAGVYVLSLNGNVQKIVVR